MAKQPLWVRGLVGLLVTGCLISLTSGLASADTAAEVQAKADQAAAQIRALQDDVARARRDYQTALRGLGGSVVAATNAERHADYVAEQARLAASDRTQALRALAQSGGNLGMIDTVLTADSPGELAAKWQLGQQVLAILSDRSQTVETASNRSDIRAAKASDRADQAVATASQVQAAYDRLQSLMDQQQAILDQLDARAQKLAKAERAAQRLAAERAAAAAAASNSASHATAGGIPKNFLVLYQAAATTCHGMSWPVLAAIGQVESGHGSNNGPSSSGAEGPMQFLPSTFAAYAVDGDHDGDKDIWDPADSIYTAANYLCANGAGNGPRGLYNALWNYNHADWYVQMVASIAAQIARRFGEPVPVAEAP